jgi:hypothetical protein
MGFSGQWADTLRALESLAYLKFVVWGASSILVGSGLLAWVLLRTTRAQDAGSGVASSLARAILLGGVLALAFGAWGRSTLRLRDLAGAIALERAAWALVAVAGVTGIVAVARGVALLRRAGRDEAAVGRALGVALHALAFAIFALQLARAVER